jgi:RNA-directed DNA polymerase
MGESVIRSFDFLGYTFRRRLALNKEGKGFVGFLPAISNSAKKSIRQTIRGWQLYRKTNQTIDSLAKQINPQVRGWINYYGKYYRSEVTQTLFQIERHLRKWAQHKWAAKTGPASKKRARKYIGRICKYRPKLFIHWEYGMVTSAE